VGETEQAYDFYARNKSISSISNKAAAQQNSSKPKRRRGTSQLGKKSTVGSSGLPKIN